MGARSSSRTRPPSSASSSALSLMRRTTSATWSSLTSSSPPPPKSLSLLDFTTSPNFRNFQETEKKKDQWNCKGASRGERKKAPSTPSGAADANLSKPGHIANAKHRNEIFRVIIVSDPFVRRSKFSHHLR